MAHSSNPEIVSPQADNEGKRYHSPELVEYGDIQAITCGDSGGLEDFPGTRKDTI